MSKKEFVDAYAKATGEIKKRAEELVNAFLETAEEFLVKGENIQFVGWGTFEVKERAAREGRNPSTGDPIQIEAKKVVKFKVGKKLAGTDSSGKETQTKLLYERVKKIYDKTVKISFPNYDSPACKPVS